MMKLNCRIIFTLAVLLPIMVAPVNGDPTVPEETIYGHVYDSDTGNPVSGAWVRCEGKAETTDAEGYYAIEGGFAPSKSYSVTCYASGYPESTETVKTGGDGEAEANFFMGTEKPDKPAKETIATEKIEYHPFVDMPTNIIEGTWILNLDDAQISMVLYQSGDLLFGTANSETLEPWNDVVSGSAEEGLIELEILSLQDGVLVYTQITGTTAEGCIVGSFVQSDSSGRAKVGNVMGFLTSPETSGYEQAD